MQLVRKMLCLPTALENLPSVLVLAVLFLQKHIMFQSPDHQQTADISGNRMRKEFNNVGSSEDKYKTG